MKIAILYSGRILNYDKYYANLQKYIVKDNDVDYYLSHSKELNEDLSGFIEQYKPKLVIDENINYNGSAPPHYNGMCMFYNRYRMFQAFKQYCLNNSIKYDCVMVSRIDILVLSEVNFNNINLLDINRIYVPNINQSAGVNDFIAIGNLNAIEVYCNLFAYYERLLKISNNTQSNELLLKIYLDCVNMNITLFEFNCLLRETIWKNGGMNINISYELIQKLLN